MSKSIYKKLSMGLLALLLNNNYLNLSAMESEKTSPITDGMEIVEDDQEYNDNVILLKEALMPKTEEQVVREFRSRFGDMSYNNVKEFSCWQEISVVEDGKLKTVEKGEITFARAMVISANKYQKADAKNFEKEFKSCTKNDALKQKIVLGNIDWQYFSNNLEKKRFQIEVQYNNGDVKKYPENLKDYWQLRSIAEVRTGGYDLETTKGKIRELEPETNEIKEIKVHIPKLGPELFDEWEWK